MKYSRPTILDTQNYTWKEWVTFLSAVSAILFAIFSIFHFGASAQEQKPDFFENPLNLLILSFWTCAPPAWFFCEYYILWPDASEHKKEQIRIGRELAKPFWAAVLATLLLIMPK
jgi:hypothetical protein